MNTAESADWGEGEAVFVLPPGNAGKESVLTPPVLTEAFRSRDPSPGFLLFIRMGREAQGVSGLQVPKMERLLAPESLHQGDH